MLRTLALALLLTGCDGFSDFRDDPLGDFELRLQITEARISLGDNLRVPVVPGEPQIVEQSIETDLGVQRVDEIQAISLRPSAFEFTAVQAPGAAPPSGTVRVFLAVDGAPVPGAPVSITIQDGVVTAITPSQIATPASRLDADAIDAFVASVPPESRPTLVDYRSLPIDEIRERIRVVLSEPSVPVALGIEVMSGDPQNPLAGVLAIRSLRLSGIVTR